MVLNCQSHSWFFLFLMSESWQGWNHQSFESHSEIVGNALNRFFYVGVGRFGPFWSHYSSYSTFFHFLPKLHSLSDAVQILVSFHLCACHWKWMFSISDVSDFTPANILLTLQEVKLHSHSLSSLKHHITSGVLNQSRYRPEWASPPNSPMRSTTTIRFNKHLPLSLPHLFSFTLF